MQRVVVTGATSMLGSAFIRKCVDNNVEVLAICRKNSRNANRIQHSKFIQILECDLTEMKSCNIDNLSSYDVFYHFGWSNTDKKQRDNPLLQNENIQFTFDCVELAKKLGCTKFIGAGSQAEYGVSADKITPYQSVSPTTAYGVAKYAAGELSKRLCNSYGIEHIWTRIFSVYGRYDNENTMIMYLANMLLNGDIPKLTKCEQQWDYLHCDDAAKAFLLLGEKGQNNKIYNIASGTSIELKQFVEGIKNSIDKNLIIKYGDMPYANNQVINLSADIDNLTLDTGFTPEISFEEGIKKTVEWIKGRENDK